MWGTFSSLSNFRHLKDYICDPGPQVSGTSYMTHEMPRKALEYPIQILIKSRHLFSHSAPDGFKNRKNITLFQDLWLVLGA